MRRFLYLTFLVLAWFCISGCESRIRDVIVVWHTAQDDVIYQQYHRKIKKEFRSRGYHIRLHDCFLDNGKYGGKTLPERLSSGIDDAVGDRLPDLILAYGDFCHHVVMLNRDKRLEEIPIVSFGMYSEEISGYPYPRNVAVIRDSITVRENLDFVKFIFNDQSRVISLLDTRSSWVDRSILNSMIEQMACLDTSRYFNGLGLRCSVKDLDDAAKSGKIVYYALSLENTSLNRNPDTGEQFSATWAFFSQKSDNRVLMVKHDQVSEMLQYNPDFPLYCTAVAEGFDFLQNCIGGHFCPFESQVRDAVDKAVMLWNGVSSSSIPESWHSRDYYANWDALRGFMSLSDMPDYVHILNTRLSDRQPILAAILKYSLMFALSLLTFGLLIVLQHYASRNYYTRKKLARVSRESIDRMESFNLLLKGTNSVSWTIDGDTIIYESEGDGLRHGITLSERCAQSNPFYREKLEHFFANDRPGNYTLQIERQDFDGMDRWYELRMTVADTIDGLRKSGITINIDEEKKMEASLHEAHRRLALANERENFISAMSHEMRTPLNSIVGFSQILTSPGYECTEDEMVLFGKAIEDSNHELMKIIEDMLALTHMDNSNIRIDLKDYRVSTIFEHFENDQIGHENAPERTVRCIHGPEGSVIRVDVKILDSVWKNIVGNAIKFSDPDTPVTVGWTESPAAVSLFVSDQGIGIEKSNQDIIFNRFYQVDHFTQGTGLGLALSKEYVTRMGGSITVESEPGKGSTFYVRFPKIDGGQKS